MMSQPNYNHINKVLFLVVDRVDLTATRGNHEVEVLTATTVTLSTVLSDSLCELEFPLTVCELNTLVTIVAS